MNPEYTDYRIKVYPRSHQEHVEALSDGRYAVHTLMPAEHNLANLDIILQLSRHLGVPQKNIVLIRGHTSPTKTLRVYT